MVARRLSQNVFRDDLFTLYDGSDRTKKARFQLSGITADNTRVLTVPDASGVIALEGAALHDGFSDFVANEHIDWTNASANFKTAGSGIFEQGLLDPEGNLSVDLGSRELRAEEGDVILNWETDGLADFGNNDITTSESIISTGGNQTGKFLTGSAGNTVFSFSGGNFDIRAGSGGASAQNVLRVTSAGHFDFYDGSLTTTGPGTFADLTISASGEINFRDTDISIGSTLTDGILDMSADVSIDMFYDNAAVGDGVDGQRLNINRRTAAGSDYIRLYVDKDRKGLIGFNGDDDLLQLAANALTVNGTLDAGAITGTDLTISSGSVFLNTDGDYGDKVDLYNGMLVFSHTNEVSAFWNTNGNASYYVNYTGYLGGTSQYRDYYICDGKTNIILAVDGSAGNVGIGERWPQDKLEVNGTVLVKDKLKLTQDDGNEYIDSLADGYLDEEATTGIRWRINGTEQINLVDGVLAPTTDDDIDLGDSTHKFKDAFFDGTVDSDAYKIAGTAMNTIPKKSYISAQLFPGTGSYGLNSYVLTKDEYMYAHFRVPTYISDSSDIIVTFTLESDKADATYACLLYVTALKTDNTEDPSVWNIEDGTVVTFDSTTANLLTKYQYTIANTGFEKGDLIAIALLNNEVGQVVKVHDCVFEMDCLAA